MEKVTQFVEKGKGKDMTFDEHYEEFEKVVENLSLLEQEALRPKKKRKVIMKKKALKA
uniref:Uncharacterized protein n=1 Tax=Cucumis melo TaxID=3656 RepID=A0A9I9DJH0_CUCME